MTKCNKSVYLANKSIDMIDAVNKGYEYGYNNAIDDFMKSIRDIVFDYYTNGAYINYDDLLMKAEQLKEMEAKQ